MYAGHGYYNDIDSSQSCLGFGEYNGAWYKIYITQPGFLGFNIIPNDSLNDDYDWARANPDGFLTYPDGSKGILEVKSGRAFDVVPLNYRAQVFWYMFVTGLRKAKLVGLFFGSDLREFDIEWNQFEFDAMFNQVLVWRECVLAERQPAWDGAADTFETVKLMNPDLNDGEWVELSDLGVSLSNAQAAFDVADRELNTWKSATLDQMGSAKYGFVEVQGERLVVAQRSLRAGKPVLTVKKGKHNG
jgi:hypothetical protein